MLIAIKVDSGCKTSTRFQSLIGINVNCNLSGCDRSQSGEFQSLIGINVNCNVRKVATFSLSLVSIPNRD